MPERSSYAPGVPSWVDLATTDPAAARDFYGQLFGWEFDVSPDEQLGHYTTVTKNGKTVAGMVGTPMTEQPPAWATYFATDDVQKLSERITDNGGAIVMGPDPVGQLGSMLVWQDPTGAFVGAWQAGTAPRRAAGQRARRPRLERAQHPRPGRRCRVVPGDHAGHGA